MRTNTSSQGQEKRQWPPLLASSSYFPISALTHSLESWSGVQLQIETSVKLHLKMYNTKLDLRVLFISSNDIEI